MLTFIVIIVIVHIALVHRLYAFYVRNFYFALIFLRFQQVKCKNLPQGAGSKILEQLFREANVQSHVHKIRHTFFKSLQCLLGKCLTGEYYKTKTGNMNDGFTVQSRQ